MTRTQKTILIFVFISLSLWRLFEVPAVANAFWAFCTVGALPWTDATVPPQLLLKMLIMTFPLALLIIFREEFLAAVPHRQFVPMINTQVPMPEPAVAERKLKKSPVIIVLPVKVPMPLSAQAKRRGNAVARIAKVAILKIAEYGVKSSEAMYSAARALLSFLGSGAVGLWSVLVALWRVVLLLWQLAEPYIRQFDHWLDVTLHRSRRFSFLLDIGTESRRFIVEGAQKKAYAYRRTRQR